MIKIYTPDDTIKYTLNNNLSQTLYFGADFNIEKMVNNKWEPVDTSDFVFIMILYNLAPNESQEMQIQLDNRFACEHIEY